MRSASKPLVFAASALALVAATGAVAAGVAASSSGTRPWISLGPGAARTQFNGAYFEGQDSGRVTGIRLDPTNPGTVYVATAGGGLWKATEFGSPQPTWTPISDTLAWIALGAVELDASGRSIFVGMGDPFDATVGAAVARSDDGGRTWLGPSVLRGFAHPADSFPVSPRSVREVRVDPANPDHLLATSDDGLWRSTDAGATFSLVDLPNTLAWPNLRESTWSIVYLGSVPLGFGVVQSRWLVSGVYACPTAAGATAPVLPPAPGQGVATCPGAVSALGNAGDVWRSDDSGQTWTSLRASGQLDALESYVWNGQTTQVPLGRVALGAGPPTADGATTVVYGMAASVAESGAPKTTVLFKSVDGGVTFAVLAPGVAAPTNPTTPSTSCTTLNLGGVVSSRDLAVAVDPGNADRAVFGGYLCGARTVDGGATFQLVSHYAAASSIAATANGRLPYVHHEWITAVADRLPGGQPIVLAGTSGGLFVSSDVFDATPELATWRQPDVGLVSHQVQAIASGDPARGSPGLLFAGLKDNGVRWRLVDDESAILGPDYRVWDEVLPWDGGGVAIAEDGPSPVLWASTSGARRAYCLPRLYDCSRATRIQNGVEVTNWRTATLTFPSGDGDPGVVRFSPVGDGSGAVVTATLFNVWKATVDAATGLPAFKRLTPTGLGGGNTQGRGAEPSPFRYTIGGVAARLYGVPLSGGNVLVVTDQGTTTAVQRSAAPVTVPDGLGGSASVFGLSSVAFPRAAGSLGGSDVRQTYVAASSATVTTAGAPVSAVVGHLFKTADNGATWTPLHGDGTGYDLPNVPVYVVKFDPTDATDRTIWVGTDLGVFRTTDGGATWAGYGHGLPNVRVTDLTISPNGSLVRIATFGRGVWEIYPNSEPPVAPGTGDFDRDGVVDFFDVAALAARLGTDPVGAASVSPTNPNAINPRYDSSLDLDLTVPAGGTVTKIDETDLLLLLAKLGSAP